MMSRIVNRKWWSWWLIGIFLLLSAACSPSQKERPTKIPTQTPTPTPPAVATARPTKGPTATTTPTLEPSPIPPQNTPQPAPTRTLRPTATVTMRPSPTLPPGALVEWPELNHDLLFVADDALKLWNHETRQLEVLLASTVTEISSDGYWYFPLPAGVINELEVSADGQVVVVSRVVTGDPLAQQLIWVNLKTGETRVLADEIPYLWELTLSPDGRQVAYISGDIDTSWRNPGPESGTVYLQEPASNEPAVSVGPCLTLDPDSEESAYYCYNSNMLWSSNGEELLWSDARGVVAYELSTGVTDVLQANNFDLPESFQVNVYLPIDWSPSGRYLRLNVVNYEGGSEAILDTETQQLFEVPATFSYEGPVITYVSWMLDDRLLLVRPSGPRSDLTNFVEIWKPSPAEGLLIMEGSLELPANPDVYSKAPIQLTDGSLAFAVLSLEPMNPTSGLYRLESLSGVPQQLSQSPWIWWGAEVYWAPDGSGALVDTGSETLMYISADEPNYYALRPLVGRYIWEVHWLPRS